MSNASSARPAVGGRVGQGADGLEQLHDRAGPPVRHDQRQRIFVPRLHVDEVDPDAVDVRGELRQRVQPLLAAPPVVVRRPVPGELLDGRQLDTLRPIVDQLLAGQACDADAAAKVIQGVIWVSDIEGFDADAIVDGRTHQRPPCC